MAVPAVLALGLVFFAWRNWHYNGFFSVFGGTQLNIMALWQPGMPFAAVVPKWIDSVLMVITVHDPPQFDWKSLPVLFGAAVAPLAVLGVPRLREVPASRAVLPGGYFGGVRGEGLGVPGPLFRSHHRCDLRAGRHWHPAIVTWEKVTERTGLT